MTDYLEQAGPDAPTSSSSASTSSATAAPPASATPARCPRRSRAAIEEGDLVVASVLSGNRNFEGRIHSEVQDELPRLAAAGGRLRARRHAWTSTSSNEPLGNGTDGKPVYLRDIWPTQREVQDVIATPCSRRCSAAATRDVFAGDERWNAPRGARGRPLRLGPESTYVKQPALLRGHGAASRRRSTPITRRARAGAARRQRHHRPHLAGRLDPPGQPGRPAT